VNKRKKASPHPIEMAERGHFSKTEIPKRAIISKAEIFSLRPKWLFGRMDWVFSSDNLEAKICKSGKQTTTNSPKVECCLHLLTERLKSFETMTWQEIIVNDKLKSHFIALEDLRRHNRKLSEKFESLARNEAIDEPFSFRLGFEDRLWGIVLNDGTFVAVFYDPNHLGWPIDR